MVSMAVAGRVTLDQMHKYCARVGSFAVSHTHYQLYPSLTRPPQHRSREDDSADPKDIWAELCRADPYLRKLGHSSPDPEALAPWNEIVVQWNPYSTLEEEYMALLEDPTLEDKDLPQRAQEIEDRWSAISTEVQVVPGPPPDFSSDDEPLVKKRK